ncbi:unnamed protein product [Closterium sp. NIES-53]
MTCTRPDIAYPLSIQACYVAPGRHRPEHYRAATRILSYLCSTSGMGLVLGGRVTVVLTGHSDASWDYERGTQRSSQDYTFSLGTGLFSWRSTRSSCVLSSSYEAEIYVGAMAAQELRRLTYLLFDLELQQRGQLHLAYVASQANSAVIFTKALGSGDHQCFFTVLGLLALFLVLIDNAQGSNVRGSSTRGAAACGAMACTAATRRIAARGAPGSTGQQLAGQQLAGQQREGQRHAGQQRAGLRLQSTAHRAAKRALGRAEPAGQDSVVVGRVHPLLLSPLLQSPLLCSPPPLSSPPAASPPLSCALLLVSPLLQSPLLCSPPPLSSPPAIAPHLSSSSLLSLSRLSSPLLLSPLLQPPPLCVPSVHHQLPPPHHQLVFSTNSLCFPF